MSASSIISIGRLTKVVAVDEGIIDCNNEIRLLRDNKVVHKILSLNRFKVDVTVERLTQN